MPAELEQAQAGPIQAPAVAPAPAGHGDLWTQVLNALGRAHLEDMQTLREMRDADCFSSIANLDLVGKAAAHYDRANGTTSTALLSKALGNSWRFALMHETYERALAPDGNGQARAATQRNERGAVP